jgi:hypothetical protein
VPVKFTVVAVLFPETLLVTVRAPVVGLVGVPSKLTVSVTDCLGFRGVESDVGVTVKPAPVAAMLWIVTGIQPTFVSVTVELGVL